MNAAQKEALAHVKEVWAEHIGTHYETCWLRHAACLARLLTDLEDEPSHSQSSQ